ncbi:alpha/beta hydrolase fold domain-containing protein [Streptomyces mirabilis]|uniref:alpha/beta hydrolase fold domain-containing protein n=1 Tax=Streptomyces mirabilis TaxID=68239 RepID=UPI0037FB58EE
MPIDPSYGDRHRALAEVFAKNPTEQEVRDLIGQLGGATAPVWCSPDVVVQDISVPGPRGPIPLRTYRPVRSPVTSALLWAHGGGFEGGDLDMPEAHRVSGELARRAGAFVVSVDYRLARDGVRHPVPLDDVHAAWNWLGTQGLSAVAPGGPLALGGASAGATLALATALRSRDHAERLADALLLAYPCAHFPVPALDAATAVEMSRLPQFGRFTPIAVERIVRNYVGRISDLPAEAMPGHGRLDGLPATHLVLSEYDDLRPSGELLQRQLEEAGVPVGAYLARGMLHGHLNIAESVRQVEESISFFAAVLKGAVADHASVRLPFTVCRGGEAPDHIPTSAEEIRPQASAPSDPEQACGSQA